MAKTRNNRTHNMTTGIKLTDMKTNIDNRQNTILRKTATRLLLLLTLLCGSAGEAWAATYHYVLLRADGEEVFRCNNTAFGIPDDLKTNLVTNYQYWNNKTARETSNRITSVSDMVDGGTYYYSKINNNYVRHYKVFVLGRSLSLTTSPSRQFVGVTFEPSGIEEQSAEEGRRMPTGDVFDLQGRRVATEQQVQDGTWQRKATQGVYIRNGRKFVVK